MTTKTTENGITEGFTGIVAGRPSQWTTGRVVEARIAEMRRILKPSPVRLDHLPNWLRLRCLKVFGSPWHGGTCGWAAREAMRKAVDAQFSHVTWLDHQGSTPMVGGGVAWVTEPYGDVERLAPVMSWLAHRLGCRWYVTSNSWWYPGFTVRGGLHP